jgi:hypothetical protein
LLRTQYRTAFAHTLKVALQANTHTMRAPANAIFASLIQKALFQVRRLEEYRIENESVAYQAAVEANNLLSSTPLGVVQSPVCDLIAGELYTLSQRIGSAHPRHHLATVVGAKALMISGNYAEAAHLLYQCESNEQEIAAVLLDCLLNLGAYKDLAKLHEAVVGGGHS